MGCNEPYALIPFTGFICFLHLTPFLVCCVCGLNMLTGIFLTDTFKYHYTNKAQPKPVFLSQKLQTTSVLTIPSGANDDYGTGKKMLSESC